MKAIVVSLESRTLALMRGSLKRQARDLTASGSQGQKLNRE